MFDIFKDTQHTIGTAPGTVAYVGQARAFTPWIELVRYSGPDIDEACLDATEEQPAPQPDRVSWYRARGIHDTGFVQRVGAWFGLHPLALEDICDTTQRPKAEEHEAGVFVACNAVRYDATAARVVKEHISFLWGDTFVLSFQPAEDQPSLDAVLERVRKGKGRIRTCGADYLMVALLDAVVDGYYPVLSAIGQELESIDASLMAREDDASLLAAYALKRELLFMRNSAWPLHEAIGRIAREEMGNVDEPIKAYLRDVLDHAHQVVESLDTLHAIASGLLDVHVSLVGYRMNAVMKILTTIATIFIPLTFLAGVYGMNFRYMPELEWTWGYPLVLAVMAALAGGMVVYFKRRKWF
ncbi:MAG: magnesium/cobalt transporter CorA [Desulfovibrionaceae bacterium]